jgi:hypothetical protein
VRTKPLASLLDEQPRLIVQPMGALLADGTFEQRLNARVIWPADEPAPDFAVHLLADFATGHASYSRSGLEIALARELRLARLSGSAILAMGRGAGPGQATSLSFGVGSPLLSLELRTTWLRGATSDRARSIGDGYSDGELNARNRMGPITVLLTGGRRFGGGARTTRQWLFGEASLPIPALHRFGIILSGGLRPDRTELAQPGGRFALLGLRMDTGAAARSEPSAAPMAALGPRSAPPVAVPLDRDHYLVRFSVPGGSRVELKGDITDWTVIPLCRATAGGHLWETTLHKPAGFYHVNIRVDGGEWIVPPGLVAVPDRFGGSTGILNLPASMEANDEA